MLILQCYKKLRIFRKDAVRLLALRSTIKRETAQINS